MTINYQRGHVDMKGAQDTLVNRHECARDRNTTDVTKPYQLRVCSSVFYLHIIHVSSQVMLPSPIRNVFKDHQVVESQVPVDRQVSLRRRAPSPMLLLLLPSPIAANTISSSHRYRFLPQQGARGRVGGRRARRLLAAVICASCCCSFGPGLHASHISL